MRERNVLASVIQNREAFDTIEAHVDRDDFTEQGYVVWAGVCDYYDSDGYQRS